MADTREKSSKILWMLNQSHRAVLRLDIFAPSQKSSVWMYVVNSNILVFQTTNYWYLKKRQEYPSDGKCTHILQLSFTPHKFIKEFSSTSSKKIPLRFVDILFKELCLVWWSVIKSNSCQGWGRAGRVSWLKTSPRKGPFFVLIKMDLKVAIDLHLWLIYLLCEPTDYDNAMGRIIAVNLAHWRKREEKRQLQEKREYQGNVQEMIETTNEGKFEKFPPFSDRLCHSEILVDVKYHLYE